MSFMGANLNTQFEKEMWQVIVAVFFETDKKYSMSLEPVLSSWKFFKNVIIERYSNAVVTKYTLCLHYNWIIIANYSKYF